MNSDENEISCAALLKAIADETRLTVVRALLKGDRYVGELMEELQIEQSLLSHHLSSLRKAGIVESERVGKAVVYRLAKGVESRRQGDFIDLGCCKLTF